MHGDEPKLRAIGDVLARIAGPGIGYALFVVLSDGPNAAYYVSNANRQDMIQTLDEWLARTRPGAARTSEEESAEKRAARGALENRCRRIGERMLRVPVRFAVFFFDLGQGGNLAYFTSDRSETVMRDGITRWVADRRGDAQT